MWSINVSVICVEQDNPNGNYLNNILYCSYTQHCGNWHCCRLLPCVIGDAFWIRLISRGVSGEPVLFGPRISDDWANCIRFASPVGPRSLRYTLMRCGDFLHHSGLFAVWCRINHVLSGSCLYVPEVNTDWWWIWSSRYGDYLYDAWHKSTSLVQSALVGPE